MNIINQITTLLSSLVIVILFSPFLLLEAVKAFVKSPLYIFGQEKMGGYYLAIGANILCSALLVIIVVLLIQRQFVLSFSVLLLGLAIQCFVAYIPILLDLPRELSGEGLIALYLPAAILLFLASAYLFVSYLIK